MNRVIKFRAKKRNLAQEQFPKRYPKTQHSFVYGTGFYNDGFNTWMILESKNECFAKLKADIVDENTICQSTGLLDKNNKEIFVGDIIEYRNSEEWGIGDVVWDESRLSFGINFTKPNVENALLYYFQCKEELEVMGNIFEEKE